MAERKKAMIRLDKFLTEMGQGTRSQVKEMALSLIHILFLAAHSLGIGSVWINQLQDVCDVPAIRQVLDELGIPADHVVYGMAALGYPDDVKADKARTGKVVYVD